MKELTDIGVIRDVLDRNGFRFSKSMGQNFLTAPWVPQRIADEAGLDGSTGVLEIGPGIGCLTVQLSSRAGRVLSVELDKKLMPILAETLSGYENVEVLFGDILKQDIAALVRDNFAGMRPVVCANLPYNVTSPVLTKLLTSGVIEETTVMVQREVARRICAEPGTADYSAFSIMCAWYCDREILFDVPPDCFVPRPKVTSSVIKLKRRPAPPAEVKDEELFFRVVKAAFAQRRKTLLNALSAGFPGLSRADIEGALTASGISADVRGETLGIYEFAQICDYIGGVMQH